MLDTFWDPAASIPDEPSTPWAAAAAVVLIKGLKAAIVGLFVAVDKALPGR